jgi:hypothetical protein
MAMSGSAGTPRTLLALMYPGPFATAQLNKLGLEEHGFTVRYPLQEALPRAVTALDYATALFERCDLADADISTIVSYCAAGQIARELSPMCARRTGRAPKMVRINPEFPALDSLVRTIEAALRRSLPRPDGAELTLDLLTLQLFEELEQELSGVLLEKVGGSGSLARDLSRMQIDWVIHLTAAGKPSCRVDMADELHITAADHACAPECPARHLVVSGCSEEMFSAPGVIEAIRVER